MKIWETSFRSLFTGQTSYLLGLSGPQSLDSYRVETESRLGSNQALSLTKSTTSNGVWSSYVQSVWTKDFKSSPGEEDDVEEDDVEMTGEGSGKVSRVDEDPFYSERDVSCQ